MARNYVNVELSRFGVLVAQLESIVASAYKPPDALLSFDLLSDLISAVEEEPKVRKKVYKESEEKRSHRLGMSLVDYAASSDEEDEPRTSSDEEQIKENPEKRPRLGVSAEVPSTSAPPNDEPLHAHTRMPLNLEAPSSKQTKKVYEPSPELRLPDASLLLNSPMVPSNTSNSLDHSSRVAAAMAGSAARKRDIKGSSATYPRSKVPKGTLPHSRNVPETVGGRLLPPQLSGRSNVVTEDISKLFVKKTGDASTE